MNPGDYTLETLSAEIERIVSERQQLRMNGASLEELEQNRRLLASSQSLLSRLLIERYLPQAA